MNLRTPRYSLLTAIVVTGFCTLATGVTAEDVDSEAGFVSLFDGKTLEGWRKVGGGSTYAVDEEAIVGTVGPGTNTFLITEKTYGDFVFRCEYRLDEKGNSGIQFRSNLRQENQDGKTLERMFGYQNEIDPLPRAFSSGIYDEGRRGWLYDLKGDKHKEARAAIRLDDWNQVEIRAEGRRLRTWLNGVPVADFTDDDPKHFTATGHFGLQVHSGKTGIIRWRNLRVKELSGIQDSE